MAQTPTGVVVPDHVAINMEREKAVDRQLALWGIYERLAKDLDERLSLIWVRDDIDPDLVYGDMVPGRWHFHRDNSDRGAADSYFPVVTEDGGFREPVAADINRLRAQDLWNPSVARRAKEGQQRQRDAVERDKQNTREARQAEMLLNLKALESPGVLVNTDLKFKARPKGRRNKRA